MKALFIVSLLLSGQWAAAEHQGLSAAGKAQLKLPPDVAFVTLYVEGDGMLVTDAVKSADKKVAELQNAIQEQFKELQSFEVRELSVGDADEMGWEPGSSSVPKPKVVRQIRITMAPDTTQIYQLLDTAIRAGGLLKSSSSRTFGETNSAILYGVKDTPELRQQLMEAAWADAKSNAERMARIVGKTLGNLENVGCGTGFPEFPTHAMEFSDDLSTPFLGTDSKAVEVQFPIQVTFGIGD